MSHYGRKVAIATAVFATVGSTVFGGAALANDKRDGHGKDAKVSDLQDATANANGGSNKCLNGIPILSGGAAVAIGKGDATNSVCNANGGSADAVNLIGG